MPNIYFLLGLFFAGVLVGGFSIHEWDKVATLEADMRNAAAVSQAQTKVEMTERNANTITWRIIDAYETKLAALNAKHSATAQRVPLGAHTDRMPAVPKPAARTNAATCEEVKLQLTTLQQWISQEVAAFNR